MLLQVASFHSLYGEEFHHLYKRTFVSSSFLLCFPLPAEQVTQDPSTFSLKETWFVGLQFPLPVLDSGCSLGRWGGMEMESCWLF